ncbi:MAG: glutamate--tRNA ligase [Calditrichia bacterium]|nr:glutamate--tRNA ligase [Calditrichia bacterium]
MNKVRVRFAPSPTGFVHVGSLRTALYNYLFAKHNQGDFILRIEDTDQTRFVEGAVENLISTLKWSGLDYDEGPEKDGKYGPYFQSQRKEIYNSHIKYLLDNDNAYRCFCSAERLDQLRNEQVEKNIDPKYDGKCRKLNKNESEKKAEHESYVIRLKVPEQGETIVDDIIRGKVSFQNDLIDDQVLIKSDGYPTYHFANVVDDHLMQISHVIRGEEWLPSTPKHLILYKCFGWELPQFAHLPLLLNPDKSKLSKRQGDVAVEDYRIKGFLPQAMNNFVALLGWNKGDNQEIFSMHELIEHFSLERVNKAGSVFNAEKLNWMNGMYLRNLPDSEYLEIALEKMKSFGYDTGEILKNEAIALSFKERITTVNDLKEKASIFFEEGIKLYENEALEWIKKPTSQKVFSFMLKELENISEVNLDVFKKVMKNVQQQSGVKGQDLWMPVRAAMTGMISGPELPIVIEIFGKQKMEKLIDTAINKF